MTFSLKRKMVWRGGITAAATCLMMVSALWALDPCDHDRPKVCGGVTPGEYRIHKCMMRKLDKLSPECRHNVVKADELNRNVEHICRDDIQTFCAQYGPDGRIRVFQCLKDRYKEITMPCRTAFDDYKELGYRVRE